MVAITAIDGTLCIYAQFNVPNAPGGAWTPEREAKLAALIQEYVIAAETVDQGVGEIESRL